MKKWAVCVLAVSLLLAGCQAPAISEAEVNRKLVSYIEQYQHKNPFAGRLNNVVVNYDISSVNVDFRSHDGGLVVTQLRGTLEGSVNILGRDVMVSVPFSPDVASGLHYAEGNIYLRDMRVLNWGNLPPVLRPHLGRLEFMAAQYLENIPIYTLNHSMKEKLAASMIKRLDIQDDQLVFVL